MKNVFIGIELFVLVLLVFVYFFSSDSIIEIYLDSCVDGDTGWFIIDGKREKVRFLGIDTPESVHPVKGVEEYGKEASDYTCQLLSSANPG